MILSVQKSLIYLHSLGVTAGPFCAIVEICFTSQDPPRQKNNENSSTTFQYSYLRTNRQTGENNCGDIISADLKRP